MMKFLITILALLSSIMLLNAQQEEKHVWKVVEAEDGIKFWYDASGLDTIKGDKFDVWILETHRPPVNYEGIDGEVFRSKTYYAINLTTVKYGILKVNYYNLNNEQIYHFDYNKPPQPESIKYTYPITDNSILYHLLTELYGPGGVKSSE